MRSKEEDYLDNLLNSISDQEEEQNDSEKQDFSNLFHAPEEDFLKEFEAELSTEDDSDYLREFEAELAAEDDKNLAPYSDNEEEAPSMNLEEIMTGVKNHMEGKASEINLSEEAEEEHPLGEMPLGEEPLGEEPLGEMSLGEEPLGEMSLGEEPLGEMPLGEEPLGEMSLGEEPLGEMPLGEEPLGETPLPEGTGEEPDLAGNGDNDLMDLLSGDGDFADLENLLSDDVEIADADGTNSIDEFAQKEMNAQESATAEAEEDVDADNDPKAKTKKKKKEKGEKSGIFAKLAKLLFGEEKEAEQGDGQTADPVTISDGDNIDIQELSDENLQILKELEGASAEDISEIKEKKGKKKKEKKEKKPKEKKPKKEKAPKKPKEKKTKAVDNTPPLPKKPVILIFVMVISLMALVMLGTTLTSYQVSLGSVKSLYDKGDYTEAFKKMDGLSVRKSDQELYDKISIIATVSSEYDAYLSFQEYEQYDAALDSLVCAVGRYNLNLENAEAAGCKDEMNQMESLVKAALQEQYQMTEEEAQDIYSLRTRDEYTQAILKKMKALGLE